MGTIKIPAADVLKKIYGETEESSARWTHHLSYYIHGSVSLPSAETDYAASPPHRAHS